MEREYSGREAWLLRSTMSQLSLDRQADEQSDGQIGRLVTELKFYNVRILEVCDLSPLPSFPFSCSAVFSSASSLFFDTPRLD